MKTNPPSHDATMTLLGSVMESYSYRDFTAILRDPERLWEWIRSNLISSPEETRPRDPEDPAVAERAEMSSEAEAQAMELWEQLKPEQREAIEKAFQEMFGTTETLPASLRSWSDRQKDRQTETPE